MVYVLFALIEVYKGGASFQYEFKDKTQCEKALVNMKKRFQCHSLEGYCQEVKK